MSETTDPSRDRASDVHKLTWAALLGRWVEFARGALALPDDDPGRRMRLCVPDIIMLQAVWFALDEIHELQPDERALGLDRAELLVEKHVSTIETHWRGAATPQALRDLIHDVRTRLHDAQQRYRQV